jgi:hypothetical protein
MEDFQVCLEGWPGREDSLGDGKGGTARRTGTATTSTSGVFWQRNVKFKDKTCCKKPHLTKDEVADRITFTLTCGMEIEA